MRSRRNQHPNASQQHRHIPLDVLQPNESGVWTIDAVTPVSVDITDVDVIEFNSSADLWIEASDLATTLPATAAIFNSGVYYLFANTVRYLTFFNVNQLHLLSASGNATVVLNSVERWLSLDTDLDVENR